MSQADVVVWADGGDKAKVATDPVVGALKPARFLISVAARGSPERTEVTRRNGVNAALAPRRGAKASTARRRGPRDNNGSRRLRRASSVSAPGQKSSRQPRLGRSRLVPGRDQSPREQAT
jgi:hypothetical protein